MGDQCVTFSAQIKYSVMHPGTHVWPHTGPTNCRLRMHLGLVIPREGCKIRCANETKYVSCRHFLSYHLWRGMFITTNLCWVGLFLFLCNWSRLGWMIVIQTLVRVPSVCFWESREAPEAWDCLLPLHFSPHHCHLIEEPSHFSF